MNAIHDDMVINCTREMDYDLDESAVTDRGVQDNVYGFSECLTMSLVVRDVEG